MPQVEVRALGSLEVRSEGRVVAIAGAKPRAVLSVLGLHAGHVVPADALVEVLWGDDPPRTATMALRTHVSALRRSLGDTAVATKGPGWVLTEASTDAARFELAARRGREAARAGDASSAVSAFTQALDAWRGPPELPDTPRAHSEIARWTEEHDAVAEDRFDALLALGEGAALVADLEASVAAAPLRERRWAQLMLALYRAGRQAEALAAYRRARTLLSDQLGVEPGPDLRRIEARILDHDPQLDAPERPPSVPAGSTPTTAGLPVPRTTFVGRRDELARIDAQLRDQSLVTIVGPGGVGKTRLALAAAAAAAGFGPGRVAFVDLVPVVPAFVVQSVAAALGITERPQQPLAEAIRDRLGSGGWLLVLDNCEHVIDAVSEFVESLMAACPGVVILATSRERLGASGERVVTVPPLSIVSAETGEVKGSEAATLFLDRARAVDPDFDPDPDLVGQACARLDGIPLAIELAAARCASLGIDGVLAGLVDRMRLLKGARGTGRHRSLRAVLDWSHDLLDEEERAAFRRVAVFAGGFDLTAVASVGYDPDRAPPDLATVADVMGRLTDKNLLAHHGDLGRSSWRLLEIVRVYALERLAESAEEPLLRARHLRWAAEVAERLERRLVSGEPWRAEFDVVVDDLRAALSRASTPDAVAYRLACALGHLAYARSFLAEARGHYQHAAAHASDRDAAAALRAAADVAFAEMRHNTAFDLQLEAAARTDDDSTRSIAIAAAVTLGARHPGGFPEALSQDRLAELLDQARAVADVSSTVTARIAAAAAWAAEPFRARCDGPLGERALELALLAGDPVLISAALDGLTTVALGKGRTREAAQLASRRLDLLDRLEWHDPQAGGEIVDIFHMATETALAAGDLPGALAAAERARDDALGGGVPRLATSRLVLPLALCGAFQGALREAAEMWAAWARSGRPTSSWMAPAVYATALVHGLTGDERGFRYWSEQARALTPERQVQGFAPFVDCRVALHSGRLDDSTAIGELLPPAWMGKFDAYARAIVAEAAVVAELPDAAARLGAVAPLAEENDWVSACLLRARGRLTGDQALLDRSVAEWEHIDARFERACTLLLVDGRADEGHAELTVLGCPPPGAP